MRHKTLIPFMFDTRPIGEHLREHGMDEAMKSWEDALKGDVQED